MIFALFFCIALFIFLFVLYIPKSGTTKEYQGFVSGYHHDSRSYSYLTTDDLVLEVDIGGKHIKKVRGSHYHLNTDVKITCVETYFFGSESCVLALEPKSKAHRAN